MEKKQRFVDVSFWYYEDEKSFVPLVATFDKTLSRDEQTVLTIMRATTPEHVKKVKAKIVFD